MATYYLDCEFDVHNGPLLSLALIHEDGRSFYYVATHKLGDIKDPWVEKNVLPIIFLDQEICDTGTVELESGDINLNKAVRQFLGYDEYPWFIADSPVDVQRLSNILSTNPDGSWCPCSYKEIMFQVFNVDSFPNDLEGCVQHNAWHDAMALCYKLTGHHFTKPDIYAK